MKTVKLAEVLEYYDGILLFTARDPIGGNYLCEAIDTVSDFDLRTLMLEAPEGEWYITIADGTTEDPLTLEAQDAPLTETEYLPGEGYFLGPKDAPDNVAAIARALERGKVISLTGLVEQANRSAGEWALLTGDGIQSGRTYPGGPGLDGLQVGKYYRFKCAQVTELDPLWRDKQVLYLHQVEQL